MVKKFLVGNNTYSLDEMLDANSDDAMLCNWLRCAKIGDVFPDGEGCERIL